MHVPAPPDMWAPPVNSDFFPPALSPSHCQWGRLVGANLFRVRVPSLTVPRPRSSARPPVYSPTLADRWVPSVGPFPSKRPRSLLLTRPHSRVSRPRPTRPSLFWTLPSFTRPSSLVAPSIEHPRPLSLALCALSGSSAAARRCLTPVL
jgi:hypothetical protein